MASLLCRVERLEEALAEERRCFRVTIWAEQNGALVNNRWNFSWGNGNEHTGTGINDWGYIMHYPWELVSLSIGGRITNTAVTEVEITVNGASVGQSITSPGGTTRAVDNTLSYVGLAGDAINFRTLQVGGANDVVVSAVIKYTVPPPVVAQRTFMDPLPCDYEPDLGELIADHADSFGSVPDAIVGNLASTVVYVQTLAAMSEKAIDNLPIAGIGKKRAAIIKQSAVSILEEIHG